MKAKLVVGISNMTPQEKVEYGKSIIAKMTGNPTFPDPTPTLEDFGEIINQLEQALSNAIGGSRLQQLERDNLIPVFDTAINQLALYVELKSNFDAEAIVSSGFSMRNGQGRIGPLPATAYLHASPNGQRGAVKLKWKPVNGAKAYNIFRSDAPGSADQFRFENTCTASNFTVENLIRGKEYWFIVYPIGAAGWGPASEIASQIVT